MRGHEQQGLRGAAGRVWGCGGEGSRVHFACMGSVYYIFGVPALGVQDLRASFSATLEQTLYNEYPCNVSQCY
jgi:hypothetical protein